MNTPDQGPKNGDFVAFLAELERRQLHANRAAVAPPELPRTPKGGSGTTRPFGSPAAPAAPGGASPKPTTLSPEAALEIARSLPRGLVIVGLVLLVAGLVVDGGGFLVLIGVLMLAQAVRAMMKAAKERAATPAQQVAALLSAHVQNKAGRK